MRLKGKVAIITGAAQGLGKGIAKKFAEEGAKCVLTDVFVDGLNQTCDEIKGKGGEALAIPTDVSDPLQVKEMVEKPVEKYGEIHVLCNNAAISFERYTEDITF